LCRRINGVNDESERESRSTDQTHQNLCPEYAKSHERHGRPWLQRSPWRVRA
jgi:hypothetical protein